MAGKRTDLGDRHQSHSGVIGLHQVRLTDRYEKRISTKWAVA